MNDLAIITLGHVPAKLTHADVESVLGYARNATAESTRIAYDADMAAFRHWCEARGLCALPASPAVVAAYLAGLADAGRKAAGIGRAAAGIAWHHRQAGIDPSPTAHEVVRQTLRGIRRTIGGAKQGKAAATADIIGKMMAAAPDNMIGLRDKALLAIGFSAALRRSELVALTVDDLSFVPDGIRLRIRRSKTDGEGIGVDIAIPRGCRICPVETLRTYMEAGNIVSGSVFRAVRLGGKISDDAMTGGAVARVLKKYCRLLGIEAASFSAHSLRAGFITSAAEAGASIWKISEVSRHASVDVLRGYIRNVEIFKGHAGSSFL